ncbi:hypothetical protein FRB95_002432 [Tulasnella sp. JGI-2019a]|nr:hypothetical protein FRB95_002432 [Tulasnella sp. JGI-2019a]
MLSQDIQSLKEALETERNGKAALADQNQRLGDRTKQLEDTIGEMLRQRCLYEARVRAAETEEKELFEAERKDKTALAEQNAQLEVLVRALQEEARLLQGRLEAITAETRQALESERKKRADLNEANRRLASELEDTIEELNEGSSVSMSRMDESNQEVTNASTEIERLVGRNIYLEKALQQLQEQSQVSKRHLEATVRQQQEQLDFLQRK